MEASSGRCRGLRIHHRRQVRLRLPCRIQSLIHCATLQPPASTHRLLVQLRVPPKQRPHAPQPRWRMQLPELLTMGIAQSHDTASAEPWRTLAVRCQTLCCCRLAIDAATAHLGSPEEPIPILQGGLGGRQPSAAACGGAAAANAANAATAMDNSSKRIVEGVAFQPAFQAIVSKA